MHIIAIANQKGGCGKTTTAINLAAGLGKLDQRVLLIDMDPQGHASLGLGINDRCLTGLYEVFSDKMSLAEVILPAVTDGVDLVPANIALAAVEPLLADQPGRERQLLGHIEPLKDRYDYILIDCPPALGLLSINALRSATQILTPLDAGLFALDGIHQLQCVVNLLQEKYALDLPIKAVLTMFDDRTRLAQTIHRHIRDQLQVAVSGVRIRTTVRAREAVYFGKPLSDYAPQCTAADDYRRLAEEIHAAGTKASADPIQGERCFHQQESIEEPSMSVTSERALRQMVVLTFNDIDCDRLQLAGDFNDWIPDQNIETRKLNGRWQKVFTAEPGVYEYRLLVDGKWQADPTNPYEIPNDLGGINSLLQVPVHL